MSFGIAFIRRWLYFLLSSSSFNSKSNSSEVGLKVLSINFYKTRNRHSDNDAHKGCERTKWRWTRRKKRPTAWGSNSQKHSERVLRLCRVQREIEKKIWLWFCLLATAAAFIDEICHFQAASGKCPQSAHCSYKIGHRKWELGMNEWMRRMWPMFVYISCSFQ